MDNEFLVRFEKLEKKVNVLERAFREADKRDNRESIVEMDLTLPEADIDGLHFNEQKVHAVFEKQADGWYHSRDILFLSARNIEDDNSRDVLTDYLRSIAFENCLSDGLHSSGMRPEFDSIEISLPTENEGIKQYNGVDWWYWLKNAYSGSAASFCVMHDFGLSHHYSASSVGGCALMFRIVA